MIDLDEVAEMSQQIADHEARERADLRERERAFFERIRSAKDRELRGILRGLMQTCAVEGARHLMCWMQDDIPTSVEPNRSAVGYIRKGLHYEYLLPDFRDD